MLHDCRRDRGRGLAARDDFNSGLCRVVCSGGFFAKTRGISKEKFDQLGLFANALGFDSRFAIMNIMDHRACSIFLEQVSLANFAIVLAIFLACDWSEISLTKRVLRRADWPHPRHHELEAGARPHPPHPGRVPRDPEVEPLPAASRDASNLAAFSTRQHGVLELFRYSPGAAQQDDRRPRQSRLGRNQRHQGIRAPGFADSGYAYVIYASTILGMIVLWLFVSLAASQDKPKLLRCNLLLNIYIFSSLTVSGNSVFSIKTAALLWLLVGNLRGEALASAAAEGPDLERLEAQRWRMSRRLLATPRRGWP